MKKKPLLSQKNVQAHLDFAKSFENWTIAYWRQVVFHMRPRSIVFAHMVVIGVGLKMERVLHIE